MSPRADDKWSLKLWDAKNVEFGELNTDSETIIRDAVVPVAERAASQVVTGQLTNINFTHRVVTIFYPPTKREMECVYEDAVEELLIENRRGLIQVTGQVVLDDAGSPKKIIDVNDIRELDLSPITVDTVKVGAGVLKAKQGVTLEPATDETQQLICVADAALGIDAFARTREALIHELNEQIGMLWQEYALADDDSLDGEAIKMKQSLLAAFSEVANGA
jgi:accessory colonization factor AcfC